MTTTKAPRGTGSATHTAATPQLVAPKRRIGGRILEVVERFGLVLLLFAIILFFSFWDGTSAVFPTVANAKNILANESTLMIAAMAVLVPLVAERFDLSVGAVVATSSVVSAKLLTQLNWPTSLGILAGILVGALLGLIQGYIIAYFNANSLVITLGMSTLLAGVGTALTSDVTLLGVPEDLIDFGSLDWLGIPRRVWLFAAVCLVVAFVLSLTVFGRRLLAIGSNSSASRLVGIPVALTVMIAFVISGALAGLAGILQLARNGSAAANIGANYTLPALAAAFLGATTIRPGRFTVLGSLVGVFFVAVSVNGLTLAGAKDWVEPVFNGLAVIFAVAAAAILANRRLGSER